MIPINSINFFLLNLNYSVNLENCFSDLLRIICGVPLGSMKRNHFVFMTMINAQFSEVIMLRKDIKKKINQDFTNVCN